MFQTSIFSLFFKFWHPKCQKSPKKNAVKMTIPGSSPPTLDAVHLDFFPFTRALARLESSVPRGILGDRPKFPVVFWMNLQLNGYGIDFILAGHLEANPWVFPLKQTIFQCLGMFLRFWETSMFVKFTPFLLVAGHSLGYFANTQNSTFHPKDYWR